MGDPDDEGEVEGVDTPSVPISSQDVEVNVQNVAGGNLTVSLKR